MGSHSKVYVDKMKRRDFLKLIGVAPIAPSVLAAEKTTLFFNGIPLAYKKSLPEGGQTINRPIGFAAEDIPKDEYGWVNISTTYLYDAK